MMKCCRRKSRFKTYPEFTLKVSLGLCALWIILTQATAVCAAEKQQQETDILEPTVSQAASSTEDAAAAVKDKVVPVVVEPTPVVEEAPTESQPSQTASLPEETLPVSVLDAPPTTRTTEEQQQTVLPETTSTTTTTTTESSIVESETVSIEPSHVEPASQSTTSPPPSTEAATETATQSALPTDLPPSDPEPQVEEPRKEDAQEQDRPSDVVEEVLVSGDAYSSDSTVTEEGNKSTLPEQPSGLHDTDSSTQTQDVPPSELDSTVEVGVEKKPEEKADEEGLTFNEWTQKVLAEAEKDKQDADSDSGTKVVPPPKQRKKKNYSSTECGAKVLAYNPEATNSKSVLNHNKDDYMINPCKVKKWFVIELCEPIQMQTVDIASLELFSSRPKSFKVFLSDRFPTKDWKFAGEFETEDERTIQTFPVTQSHDYFAKFIRVELLDHYGAEHFCPITLFRVYGVAVTDDEVDVPYDDDNDDDDDDDNGHTHGDGEEDSTNLFTSAKDTVINIVKKVLNVGPDDADLPNVTDTNTTMGMELQGDLNMSGSDVDMLPCLPGARDQDVDADQTVTKAPDRIGRPVTPHPGKTDDTEIVRILEDDEQVETGNLPFGTLLDEEKRMKALQNYKHACFLSYLPDGQTTRTNSRMCYFLALVSGKCALQDLQNLPSKVPTDAGKLDKTGSSQSEVADATGTVTHSEPEISVTEKLDQPSADQSASISDTQINVPGTDNLQTTQVAQGTEIPADIKPTTVLEPIQQTDSPVFADLPTDSQTGLTVSQSSGDASVTIDPSFTHGTDQRETTVTSSGEATPNIPDDNLKSTTEKIETQDSTISETAIKDQTQGGKETSTTVPADSTLKPNIPRDTQVSTDLPQPSEPEPKTLETTAMPADSTLKPDIPRDTPVSTATTDLPQPSEPEPQAPATTVPAASATEGQESATANDTVANVVTQDKQPEKVDQTVTGQKEDSVGKDKNLNLVKVPVISSNKRESAIMRLSNRMKVLEQNVSLSSRFLEELSKRYKKQSEDMMKMLNKTLARLSNVTVESEVKHKLHEVEMTEMERRLKNLTDVVTTLSTSLNSLNQQVKDRQMIWTSIEILVIIVLFIFVNQRRRKEELPLDSQELLDRMPSEPKSGLPHRRNSISGPATSSKKKPDLTGGNPLQKFSSETALDQEFPIIQPLLPGGHQANDGVKKKKKKKQKQQQEGGKPQLVLSLPGKEAKPPPVVPPDTGHGESEKAVKSSSSTLLSIPGLSFFSSGKAVSDTGQQSSVKPKAEGKYATGSTGPVDPTKSSSEESCGNRKGVGGEFKKPPLGTDKSNKAIMKMGKSHDSYVSDKSGQRISPTWSRKSENAGAKGHRRQRSLPKQHYSLPENREVETHQSKPQTDQLENNLRDFSGVQDLPVKAGAMRKLPGASGFKRPHGVPARRSMENIGRISAERSNHDPESVYPDQYQYPSSKPGKGHRKKHSDHDVGANSGATPYDSTRPTNGNHTNGWNPGDLDNNQYIDTDCSCLDAQQKFVKFKSWPDRSRSASLDGGPPPLKVPFYKPPANGSLSLPGSTNGIAGMNGNVDDGLEIEAIADYSNNASGGGSNPENVNEQAEEGENRSGNWKKMFGLFR